MINVAEMLSKRLNLLRIKYKLSMTNAAFNCQISPALWQALESRKIKNPTLKTLLRIANSFGISLDDLIGRHRPSATIEKQERLPSFFLNHDFNQFPRQPAHTKPSTED